MLFRFFKPFIPLDDFVAKRVALEHNPINGDAKKSIDAIYAVLSTLDAKASALMRLDGVLLAAAFVGVPAKLYSADSSSFAVITLASVVSMMLCLLVVSVDWSFLGKVTGAPPYDFTEEIICLRQVRLLREKAYRVAWFFASLASAIFALVLAKRFLPPLVLWLKSLVASHF